MVTAALCLSALAIRWGPLLQLLSRTSGHLRDLYELGDITPDDYIRRRDQFVREASAIRAASEPTFVRQRTSMRSLVDDWDEMSADQRKRVLGTMFEEVIVDGDGGPRDYAFLSRHHHTTTATSAVTAIRSITAPDATICRPLELCVNSVVRKSMTRAMTTIRSRARFLIEPLSLASLAPTALSGRSEKAQHLRAV